RGRGTGGGVGGGGGGQAARLRTGRSTGAVGGRVRLEIRLGTEQGRLAMGKATSGQASIDIDAAPEAVYDLVSDLRRVGEWSPECYRCEWIQGDCPVVGAEFKGHNRIGP